MGRLAVLKPPRTPPLTETTKIWKRVHADPPVDPAPIDLTKRGRFPIARRRPDGTIEIKPRG